MSQPPTEANDKIAALAEEVDRLKAQRLLDNEDLARAYDMGRDMERAATMAWLRTTEPPRMWAALPDAADAIERGEHRREGDK